MRTLLDLCVRERAIVLLLMVITVGYGWMATRQVPLDAIPNVGENQVIVLAEWPGRSPKDVEDQVTYPLSIALQAVPGAQSVRGKSMFGFSFVQVTFADDVDLYWARSRVSEQLSSASAGLPADVIPRMAPDATALGQIYYYVLEPPPGMDLATLRAKQDFVVKYALQSVEGVAEVASIGGYVRQYQVEVDPERLQFFGLPLDRVVQAIRAANTDVGAKTIENNGMEFIVRGRGFIGSGATVAQTIEQIEQSVIETRDGVPLRIRDVARVQLGPAFRRGALDLDGKEAVGGVVVMRHGENPRHVIEAVKKKIASIEPGLGGIKIRGVYDRSVLIDETVATLTSALGQEVVITIVVVVLFLLHIRASIVVAATLPIAVLMAFIAMKWFGVDANIMSLAGIAIAIGTMVDMGIIISENIYRQLAEWESGGRPGGAEGRLQVIRQAAAEVVPAVVTAVSTTVVSFLPVFLLTGRDHRLFAPLAWTKTFSLVASLLVAVLFIPLLSRILLHSSGWRRSRVLGLAVAAGTINAALVGGVWGDRLQAAVGQPPWLLAMAGFLFAGLIVYWLGKERLRPIETNPVARVVDAIYTPVLRCFLRFKLAFLMLPTAIVLLGIGAWIGLPRVLRPVETAAKWAGADLNAVPGYVSLKHTWTGLKTDDWIALDEGSWFYMPSLYPAASFSQAMQVLQTQDALIREIPEVAHVLGKIGRVDSALDPAPAAMIETYVMLKPKSQWRDGVTERKIWDEINRVATLPGVTPASPLQPIEGRVVMLQSGIKASMAIRIYGDDLKSLAQAAHAVAERLKTHPRVNARTVNPDVVMGKPYLEFHVDRDRAARYGMTTAMVNQIVAAGLGGMDVTTTVEGRERFPIQVRYERGARDDYRRLKSIPVVTHAGNVVPLSELAEMDTLWGPAAINSEDARLVAHVAFSPAEGAGDLETVESVMESLNDSRRDGSLRLPHGNFELQAVGSFQNQIEANRRLMWVIPVVILINLFIIYLQFREPAITVAVFSGIPVAFGGGMILLACSHVEMNTAVWVGFIALFGIAVDDGVVIATYLNQVLRSREIRSIDDLRSATLEAGRKRIRPCLMTTITTVVALLPVLMSTGRGADVARAMALPVFGGMSVELVTLFVVPVVYCGYKEWKWTSGWRDRHFEVPSDNAADADDPLPLAA